MGKRFFHVDISPPSVTRFSVWTQLISPILIYTAYGIPEMRKSKVDSITKSFRKLGSMKKLHIELRKFLKNGKDLEKMSYW